MSTVVDPGSARTVLGGLHLPECPRWHAGLLWFSDMYGQTAYAMAEDGRIVHRFAVPGRPGGIGFTADGALLVCEMETGRVLRFDPQSGACTLHADVSAVHPRINDMVSAPDGRCFIGALTMEPPFLPRPLVQVDPQGRVTVATRETISVANGIVLCGGATLIVAESITGRLLAYDLAADGALGPQRLFAALPPGLNPDGICGDDAGGIWVATPHAGQVYRVEEGGAVTHRHQLAPGRLAYACAIGGHDRPTLFVCTSGRYEPEVVARDTAGRIEALAAPFPATTTFP